VKNIKSIKPLLIIFAFILISLLFIKTILFSSGESEKDFFKKENSEKENFPDIYSFSDIAPKLKNKTGKWINTDIEIDTENLKGKVVLIEFWTFGCYNCTNTIPYLNKWYDKYKSENFEMIGIHCPEFDNERNFENVKSNVEKLGIKYPVLTDNEFSIWSRYDVHAWPTIFLIDKKGEMRYKKVGEGRYEKTEQMIIELLSEKYIPEKNN